MNPTLAISLTRRQIAAVIVKDGEVAFYECHYLRSNKDTARTSVLRLVERLALQFKPSTVVLYCPATDGTSGEALGRVIKEWVVSQELPLLSLSRGKLYEALGEPAPQTSRALAEALRIIWPGLDAARTASKKAVAEAATAALIGDVLGELRPAPQ